MATPPSQRLRQADPAAVADRAGSRGWKADKHVENDKLRDLNKFDDKVKEKQDRVLNKYAICHWDKARRSADFEMYKELLLQKGTPMPPIHELKDFWRAMTMRAEPLCYGGRRTGAVWLVFRSRRIPFQQVANSTALLPEYPNVIRPKYHKSFHFIKQFIVQVTMSSQETIASFTCTGRNDSTVAQSSPKGQWWESIPFDPELHYGAGDDNAFYNIFATWPENFFSSLPKPHGNRGIDEPYLELRQSQIFLDDCFRGKGTWRFCHATCPGEYGN